MTTRPVFIVSDRTGITAETLANSLLTQFPGASFETQTLPFIDSDDKVEKVVSDINQAGRIFEVKPLVFTTFVNDTQRKKLLMAEAIFFDLFGTFIDPLERELGSPSSHSIGRSHGMMDAARYTSRISAVNFSVHCDDGLNTEDYNRAEIIFVGVSRSGKTPTCLYLALHFGVFTANYPLTEEDFERGELPKSVLSQKKKVFGITIDPERLQQIRQERRGEGRYSQYARCVEEVRQTEALFRRYRIPYIDTTAMSVEEISTTVMHKMHLSRNVLAGH